MRDSSEFAYYLDIRSGQNVVLSFISLLNCKRMCENLVMREIVWRGETLVCIVLLTLFPQSLITSSTVYFLWSEKVISSPEFKIMLTFWLLCIICEWTILRMIEKMKACVEEEPLRWNVSETTREGVYISSFEITEKYYQH